MGKTRARALSLSSWRGIFSRAVFEPANSVLSIWGAPNAPHSRGVRVGRIDLCFVALALVFPWSTTATIGLVLLSLVLILTTYGADEIRDGLKRPRLRAPGPARRTSSCRYNLGRWYPMD